MTVNLRQLEHDREEATVDKADLFDFYNDNWDALIAEVASLRESTPTVSAACDECEASIPDKAGGSIANKHHAESCSLYEPDEE